MRLRLAALLPLAIAAAAADRAPGPARAGNDEVEVTATLIVGREQTAKALGVDPGLDVVIVETHLERKSEEKLVISRDDFTMISRRDGQRIQAMHPSQIAGSGVPIVSSRAPGASGGMMGARRGPIWGGIPGTGSRPRRIGGDNDVASVDPGETKSQTADTKGKDNPVLLALREKELPKGVVNEEASGLLYFVFEGKHKPKDLDLMYKTRGGTLMLDFVK